MTRFLTLLTLALTLPASAQAQEEDEEARDPMTYTLTVGVERHDHWPSLLHPGVIDKCKTIFVGANLPGSAYVHAKGLCDDSTFVNTVDDNVGRLPARSGDVVVLSWTGYGSSFEDDTPSFLLTDTDPNDIVTSSLSVEMLAYSLVEETANGVVPIVLIDTLHPGEIWVSDDEGYSLDGPTAQSFEGTGVLALSATDGESFPVAPGTAFSDAVTAAWGADQDERFGNDDGVTTIGEFHDAVIGLVAEMTGGRQTVGVSGDWESYRDKSLVVHPEPERMVKSWRAPVRWTSAAVGVVGCGVGTFGYFYGKNANDQLWAGVPDQATYNEYVGRLETANVLVAGGAAACGVGAVGVVGSSVKLHVGPTSFLFDFRW